MTFDQVFMDIPQKTGPKHSNQYGRQEQRARCILDGKYAIRCTPLLDFNMNSLYSLCYTGIRSYNLSTCVTRQSYIMNASTSDLTVRQSTRTALMLRD